MKKFGLFLLLAVWMLGPAALAQDTNLTSGCVENYDPSVDYFPDKAEMTHAKGLEIEYHNNYKVVRTLTPYPGATEPFEYVLVQCGTPAPEGYDNAQVVDVPVHRVIALSTTMLSHLKALGQLDSLVGLDSFQFTNTPEVLDMIAAGKLAEVGNFSSINVEKILDLNPDVVMANGFNPDTDAHPVLMDAGIFTALNSDWLESTLLGRAEWIKFTALFFNEEARATSVFDDIVQQYQAVSDIAQAVPADQRITVLWDSFQNYTGAWTVPGQQTWVGELLADAGVNYVLMDKVPDQSQDFSFESVYDAGLDAPVWITNAFQVNSLDELLALDARYADFAAFANGEVYNNNARENANGGNDFWETGVTNPHLLLQDLVKIFYPDLLPDHDLVFYQKLG